MALADNGLRWHVRAFDRERQRFSDFVLTRIVKASELEELVAEHEMLGADDQWARIVDFELVPHPGIEWPKAVEADFGMTDGVLRVKTRAALAGYVLRRWSTVIREIASCLCQLMRHAIHLRKTFLQGSEHLVEGMILEH